VIIRQLNYIDMSLSIKDFQNLNIDLSGIDLSEYIDETENSLDEQMELFLKKGGKIHIKKANRGKFTKYCGGKVTSKCIAKGKNSSNPVVRKRATFAQNSRKWKH